MHEAFLKIVKYLEIRSTENRAEGTTYGEVTADAIDMCIDVIKLFVKEYNNGWIPCSKRLPDRVAPFQTSEYTVTMCFVKNGKKGRPFTSHASFDFESDKWLVKDHEVIAWREHIEPYKAESEE